MSRRDDLWSFFFILLEFLDVSLPWNILNKFNKNNDCNELKEEVRNIKEKCLGNPKNLLFYLVPQHKKELEEIFIHLCELKYEDKPDYGFIRYFFVNIIRKRLDIIRINSLLISKSDGLHTTNGIKIDKINKKNEIDSTQHKSWSLSDFLKTKTAEIIEENVINFSNDLSNEFIKLKRKRNKGEKEVEISYKQKNAKIFTIMKCMR